MFQIGITLKYTFTGKFILKHLNVVIEDVIAISLNPRNSE